MSKTTSGARSRPRLNRESIVRTALDVVDEGGVQSLSMRKLGERMGVEAMSLYRHVSGREDLLEAVVDHLTDGLTAGLDPSLTETWQGYLQAVAHEVRRIAVEHPRAFPLMATHHPAASWVRPPLRSLEVVDTFLSTLIRHGFEEHRAVQAYRAFTSFLLGHLLLEATTRGARTSPPDVPLDEGEAEISGGDARTTLDSFPTLLLLRPLLSEDRSGEEFETALETLLDRLEHSISQ